ncbi:MAG: hypothetical protein C4294_18560 [Nitrospiraceae bacterium]
MEKIYSMKGAVFKNMETAQKLATIANRLKICNKTALKFCIYYAYGFESYKCVTKGSENNESVEKITVPFSVVKTEFEPSQLSILETWMHKEKINFSQLAENSIDKVTEDYKTGVVTHNIRLYQFFPHLK